MCNDYITPYDELMNKSGLAPMGLKTMKSVCVEICNVLNNPNLCLLKEIVQLRETNTSFRNAQKLNLKTPRVNQITFGSNSFNGPKL